ncbi:MAG: FtsX-like permease family protein [Ferruginibacter sp.]
MIRNYFKIAFRNLWKHRLFSFINIFGLAAGMLVCIIALIDYNKAFDYDTFHPFPNRTYRILTDMTGKQNQQEAYASTPYPVAGELLRNYSFIENIVHVVPEKSTQYEAAGKTLPAPSFFTDASFFKMFGFQLQKGVFNDVPHTAVITEEAAKRFFGNTDVVGMSLHHRDWGEFLITGIVSTPVQKSHLSFDVLATASTIASLEKNNAVDVQSTSFTNPWAAYTYILVKDGTTKNQLDIALRQLGKQSTAAITTGSNYKSIGYRYQPLNEINPSREDLYNFPGGTTYGKLLVEMGIGLLTLLLAGFNYVNLTLARSLTRSKEIGVRKVIGASRKQVFLQFVVESVLISLLALLLSCIMLQLLKPMDAIQQVLQDAKWNAQLWGTLILFSLLTGLIAGSIPARILSALKPTMIIKGQKALTVLRGLTMRKILVVAQFAISLFGIIFMMVTWQQNTFMATGEYGFAKDNIFNIDLNGAGHQKLSNEIQKIAGVEVTTATAYTLGMNVGNSIKLFRTEKNIYTMAQMLSADEQFIRVMQLPLAAGSNLLKTKNDSVGNTILINETAVKGLHYKTAQEAVGQLIRLSDSSQVRITGVLKDFHFMSMFFPIFPMMIRNQPEYFSVLQVKVNPGINKDIVKAGIGKAWTLLNPGKEFSGKWFDKALYDQHSHGGDQLMLALLCGMVLCIACLGLLGMVTYSSEIRTKEVGIRKVMGADVWKLLVLLSREFIWLLLIAGLIAVPCGYIASNFFLYNFAFHVTIGPGTLLTGFLAMLLIGGFTIVWQTYRVAAYNPVKSLRTE